LEWPSQRRHYADGAGYGPGRPASVDRVREHVEYMLHAGLDETPILENYDAILTKIDKEG
jgi:hypothetical protein